MSDLTERIPELANCTGSFKDVCDRPWLLKETARKGSSKELETLVRFFDVQDALATVFACKQLEYGDFFSDGDVGQLGLMRVFFDIKRKYDRMHRVVQDPNLSERALCDTFGDLAVYAMIGLILLSRRSCSAPTPKVELPSKTSKKRTKNSKEKFRFSSPKPKAGKQSRKSSRTSSRVSQKLPYLSALENGRL